MFNPPGERGKTQEEYIRDLHHGSLTDQKKALQSLALIGDAEALDEVIRFLHENSEQASQALKTLNILAHKYFPDNRYDLADVVLPFLKSNSWFQRLTAVRILNTHPSELVVEPLREMIEEGFIRLTEEGKKRFSFSKNQIEITLMEAIIAIANCGKTSVLSEILTWLEDPVARAAATRGLGIIGAETERPRLLELAEDRDPRIRDAAQWSLALMDDREAQFNIPPDEAPEPPPDRLSPIYWSHRKLLEDEEDEIVRLMVVRIAIEHLILDTFINQGKALDTCHIILRAYEGNAPPEPGSTDSSQLVDVFFYQWQGPIVGRALDMNQKLPVPHMVFTQNNWPGPTIAIYYPEDLLSRGEGLISTHLYFDPQYGRGALYQIMERDNKWIFALIKKTWST